MADIVMPLARRSGAAAATTFIADIAAKALARASQARAERRTTAMLRALDDRTLHDIGLHRSEIESFALDRRRERFRSRYY
jgi:uncharacterized protein YjiS (DUF1127 family)